MRATSSSYVGADFAGTTPSLRGERAVHDLALAAQVRDERAVVDDLGRAGVAAPEADLPAGEDRGLAVLVHAPGARDVGAVDRRQQPRIAAAHEHVHDGGRVADDDVPGLLDDPAGGVARHDPEGLGSRREVVARGEAAIRIHAHRDVVDLEAGDRTIDPSAHLHRRVRERGAVRRLLDDELRRGTGRGRRRDLESHVARDAADLARGVEHLDLDVVRALDERHVRTEGAVRGWAHVRDRVLSRERAHGDPPVRDGDAPDQEVRLRRDDVARGIGHIETRRGRERRELVVEVAHEEHDASEHDDRQEHLGREDEAAMNDGAHRLERARRLWLAAALLVEEDDELVGLQVEVLRVVAQEALRIDGARERLIVPVFERLEELFADARVGGGLVERDPLLLTLRPQAVAELAHPSSRGLCPRGPPAMTYTSRIFPGPCEGPTTPSRSMRSMRRPARAKPIVIFRWSMDTEACPARCTMSTASSYRSSSMSSPASSRARARSLSSRIERS